MSIMDDSLGEKIDILTNCKDVKKAYSVLIELEKQAKSIAFCTLIQIYLWI